MKLIARNIGFLTLLLLSNAAIQAQSLFNKETKIIHVGVGLGGFDFGNCYTPLPAFNVSYDQGLIDDLGIGNLGIGGTIGIKHYNWNCNTLVNKDWSWNRVYVGARATYHFFFLNEENLDLYAGLSAGAFFWTGDVDASFGSYPPVLAPGAFGGANYWLKPNIGVYAEVGYGLGYLNTGIAISF